MVRAYAVPTAARVVGFLEKLVILVRPHVPHARVSLVRDSFYSVDAAFTSSIPVLRPHEIDTTRRRR